LNRIR